jgi:hypothetical protein
MAKVKIQGHASGTGVLTVTAPNTSTDRTITLPDGTGTLIADNGSGKVGVGTASPQNVLHVASGDSSNDNYRTGADTPLIVEGTTSSYIQFVADNNAPMGILMGNSSDSALGGVTYDDNNGQLRIKTNGSTRARFTNNGLCFNDDTAAANALDDYETGTWTPALAGVTGTFNTSGTQNYTKVGRIVTLNGYIYNCASISNTSADWSFSGLPFAPIQDAHGAVGMYNVTLAGSNSYITIRANANNSRLVIVESRSGTTGVLVPFSSIGTGHFDFTITYATND